MAYLNTNQVCHFYFQKKEMNLRQLFFYIFKAKYYVVRMDMETFYTISRIKEEKFLLVKEDHTIRWMDENKEATLLGFFQASVWVYQLRYLKDGYEYSKVTTHDFNSLHYLNGFSTALFI